MKQTLLTLALMLLPMLASADAVEIDGIYYNLDTEAKTAEVTKNPNYYSGSVVIPEKVQHEGTEYSVTSIGDSAFSGCLGLTSITIPNSVTNIGDYAFIHSGLYSVTIPNNVAIIGAKAFFACYGLKSITIPNSVASMGDGAFADCIRLTSIIVDGSNPNYKSEDGVLLSKDGTKLVNFPAGKKETAYIIPNSVTSIGDMAFNGCSDLTSITIPNSVTTIGESAFWGCTSLTSIKVESGNTKYDSRDNCNAIIETTSNTLIFGCQNTTIPNGVTSIGEWAFYDCSGLTSITIPNSVTSIGDGAFNGCIRLTSITIPNSVTRIENQVFQYCSLTSITIGNSVTSIGYDVFDGCYYLLDVFCYAENVPTIGSFTFYNSNIKNATLHVPATSVETYKAARYWKDFKEIVAIDDVIIGDANGDGVVDVADVVEIVNFILEKPSGSFVEAAADANDDKVIDAADVVAVVNIILKGGNGNPARVRAFLEENGFIF